MHKEGQQKGAREEEQIYASVSSKLKKKIFTHGCPFINHHVYPFTFISHFAVVVIG